MERQYMIWCYVMGYGLNWFFREFFIQFHQHFFCTQNIKHFFGAQHFANSKEIWQIVSKNGAHKHTIQIEIMLMKLICDFLPNTLCLCVFVCDTKFGEIDSLGGNLTNIFRAAFLYESVLCSFSVLTVCVCNFLAK